MSDQNITAQKDNAMEVALNKLPIPVSIKKHIDYTLKQTEPYLHGHHPISSDIKKQLAALCQVSHYAANTCKTLPMLLAKLLISQSYSHSLQKKALLKLLNDELMPLTDKQAFMKQIRIMHHYEMLRILWRDVNHICHFHETMQDLSVVAECFLDVSIMWLYERLKKKLGTPLVKNKPQQMIVLGMGKLGGGELNFSSDIDLIFCYPRSGTTNDGGKIVDHQIFFNKLGQSLIHIIEKITPEGFIYRVDMRLRPYGSHGNLSWSFDAMEQYYQDQGRTWERYAFIKARPVAGDINQGFMLLKNLKPFIYRRYLDFNAVDSLRKIKGLIRKKHTCKKARSHIKNGTGGIREIEFIVQCFQLVYGGKKKQLQQQNILLALAQLQSLELLNSNDTHNMRDAYLFLRKLEHLLQAYEKKQTHTMPLSPSRIELISLAMNFQSSTAFEKKLKFYRDIVATIFNELLKTPHQGSKKFEKWQQLWLLKNPEHEDIQFLQNKNFSNAKDVYNRLKSIKASKLLKGLGNKSKTDIEKFFPVFLQKCSQETDPYTVFIRMLTIIEKILKRTAYLTLLLEKQQALNFLIKLCHKSQWITDEIARYPVLLDEFLIPENIYAYTTEEEVKQEMQRQSSFISHDDVEQRLENLCYFKISHTLKTVVSSILDTIPIKNASNCFTWVAEAVLSEVVSIAWNIMIKKFGLPGGIKKEEAPFIILGYGKLGGLEMGPGSDLDLVFIHNTDPQNTTSGQNSVENRIFFARFVQKVIHLFSLQTHLGKLYEIDTRLRPSGQSGLIVSTLAHFKKYIENEAWTWEHQALIRARIVYGNESLLAKQFELIRKNVVQKNRHIASLKKEIKNMRLKMQTLDKSNKTVFDLKYGRGGVIDIEFFVQYMVLAYAENYPSLTKWTDNIRLLETLKIVSLLPAKDADKITTIYLQFREKIHQKALNYEKNNVIPFGFINERNKIIKFWNQHLDDDLQIIEPNEI